MQTSKIKIFVHLLKIWVCLLKSYVTEKWQPDNVSFFTGCHWRQSRIHHESSLMQHTHAMFSSKIMIKKTNQSKIQQIKGSATAITNLNLVSKLLIKQQKCNQEAKAKCWVYRTQTELLVLRSEEGLSSWPSQWDVQGVLLSTRGDLCNCWVA